MTYSQTEPATRDRSSFWVGWVAFGAIMMIMLGAFQAVMGLVALLDDGYYLVTRSGLVVSLDYTTWGWVHLILGLVALGTGLGAILGQTWARVVGIILATISAIVNMVFLPAYPLWSILVIAVDVVVIYALAVHGGDIKDW